MRQILAIWPYDRRFIKGLLAMLGAMLFTWLLQLFVKTTPLLTILLNGISATGMFVLLLWLQRLDDEDREIIQKLRKKFAR